MRALAGRRRIERDMQHEMAAHLDQSTARLIARGSTPAEARAAALREFGNVAYLQEQARDARGTGWIDALVADARFAFRHFAQKAVTTFTMVALLVVGLAISTLLFTYVHAYALRPPSGVERADDLVRIRGSRSEVGLQRGFRTFGEDEFREYRKLTTQFASVAGWTDVMTTFTVPGAGGQRLDARISFVTESYFQVLGVRPMLGTGLPVRGADDPSAAGVAAIGHATWEQVFARSPGVIGSTLTVNGIPVTIVGVLPKEFTGFPGTSRFQLWMPLAARAVLFPGPTGEYRAVARLRTGVDATAASAVTQAVAARMAERNEKMKAVEPATDVVPLYATNSDPMSERDVRLMSVAVGLLGLLVLLVTCTNVSALLAGLATARRQEIAIRLSLGAARTRLVRQLLTESAILGAVSGAGALALVWGVLRAVTAYVEWLPFEVDITLPVATFTFGVALTVGVLFGLSPALHATRLGLASVLRDSAGTVAAARGRLQRGLVIAQIAFTQPLIVALAAVLTLVLGEFQHRVRPAYGDRLALVGLMLWGTPSSGVSTEAENKRAYVRDVVRRLHARLEAVPGVDAAIVQWGSAWSVGTYATHPDDRDPTVSQEPIGLLGQHVATGYFKANGVPVVRGRDFTETEVTAPGPRARDASIIVGSDLARRVWGGVDPIGRRLQAVSDSSPGARTLVVVGVIDDPNARVRRAGDDYRIYLPPDTTTEPNGVLLRTGPPAQALLPTLREVAQAELPEVSIRIRTIAEIENIHVDRFRIVTAGLVAAAVATLFLSAIGLYAVVTFSVGQRTREIAVRMAIGARGQQIVNRFVRDGLRLSAIGLALGLPASVVGLSLLVSIVPDIPPIPLPRVAMIAAMGIGVVATIAAWLPARRAAAIDPAVTLRAE